MAPQGRTGSVSTGRLPVTRVQPAYLQVADQLRALILQGELLPGDRLPAEPELAATFGVSRSTVREALRTLSSQHMLTATRGVTGGTFVARPDPDAISDSLTTGLGLLSNDTLTVDELVEARELLEVPAARLAAHRRTEADLAALDAATDREAKATGPEFTHHQGFHLALLDCSHNSLLDVVTAPIFAVLETRFLRANAPARFWRDVCADHRQILTAIRDGDGDGAAQHMTDHLGRLRKTYRRIDVTTSGPKTSDRYRQQS